MFNLFVPSETLLLYRIPLYFSVILLITKTINYIKGRMIKFAIPLVNDLEILEGSHFFIHKLLQSGIY